MSECRRLPPKGFVESYVFGSRNEPFLPRLSAFHAPLSDEIRCRTYLSTDDMADLHKMVIHHIREMIRGEPISLHEDKVLLILLLLVRAINGVAEFRAAERISLEA